MIKLETSSTLPSAVVVLEIRSQGDIASISLSTDEHRSRSGESFQVDATKRKQVVTFIGADSEACSLQGVVDESAAVEIVAAYRVVLEVRVANELKASYAAGRVSQAYTSLQVARVVEVWESASKCAWRAEKPLAKSPTKEMTPDGKIKVA